MIVTQNTKLNVVPGGIIPVVHVSQFDVNRAISFTIFDGNAPAVLDSETIVTIEGTKPDGHGFQYAGTLSDNVASFNTTQQMTVIAGAFECKLTLRKDSQVIGTAMFIMDVEKAGLDSGTDISDTEIPMIVALAQEQEENAAASAAEAEAQALKSEGNAVGTQNGAAVSEESPYYHNNSRYWCTQAQAIATGDIPEMIGSTPTADGMHGLVPTPHIGDERKALMGNGTWGNVDSGTVVTYAEWQALTPEEKAVGDYYITNYPANGSFSPVGGFDTTPTLNSFVPVTSDGIARAIRPLSGSIQSISGSIQSIGGQIGNTDISGIGQTITAAIDNLDSRVNANKRSSQVDIKTAASSTDGYTCPTDGYLYTQVQATTRNNVYIYDSNGNTFAALSRMGKDGTQWIYDALFVKKGMVIKKDGVWDNGFRVFFNAIT